MRGLTTIFRNIKANTSNSTLKVCRGLHNTAPTPFMTQRTPLVRNSQQIGLFNGRAHTTNISSMRPFSSITDNKPSALDNTKIQEDIKKYLQNFITKTTDIKTTDFSKVTITPESQQQLVVIASMLDKLIIQIKNFDHNSHGDFLRFVLSHVESIDYHLKKLLGQSVYLSHPNAVLSTLIKDGQTLLKELPPSEKKIFSERTRTTVLSSEDNKQLEVKRFEEQQRYNLNPDFTVFLSKAWGYAIDNRHRTKKIFISYAWPNKNDSYDEEWSQPLIIQLVHDLTRMGYQVFLDKNHSGAGFLLASFMEKIQQVDHVLVISSRTMEDKLKKSESGVNFEYQQIAACLRKYPDLVNRRFVIPVLLNNNKYCHRDFADIAEVSICKEGYLNALESLVTPLYESGEIEFRQWWRQTVETDLHQRVVFNPPPVDPYTVQRHDLFLELLSRLQTLSHTARNNVILACVGLPGVGKTHLLRQFFHDQKRKYAISAWFNAESPDTLIKSYRDFASNARLNLLQEKESGEFSDEEIITLVKNKLTNSPESLLIYDNAESLSELEKMIPAGCHHILISSRHRVWPNMIDVDRMIETEACQLLHEITKYPMDDAMCKLANLLDRIPLALSYAGAYIRSAGISCQDYTERYTHDKKKLLSAEFSTKEALSLAHDHPSVWITWHNIFNLLNSKQKLTLNITSFLSPDNIPNLFLDQVFRYQENQEKLKKFRKLQQNLQTSAEILFISWTGLVSALIIVKFSNLLSSFLQFLGFAYSELVSSEAQFLVDYAYLVLFPIPLLLITGVYAFNSISAYIENKEKYYNDFSTVKYFEENTLYTALVKHNMIIKNLETKSFSIHRLSKDILRCPLNERETIPILIGVWSGLSNYYKTFKNQSTKDNEKLLWGLLSHFEAANDMILAKKANQNLEQELENTLIGLAFAEGGAHIIEHREYDLKNFRKKYEEFLNCYKQLCHDLKQDKLAASITNQVFEDWDDMFYRLSPFQMFMPRKKSSTNSIENQKETDKYTETNKLNSLKLPRP